MAMNRNDYLKIGKDQARAESATALREVTGSWQARAIAEGFNTEVEAMIEADKAMDEDTGLAASVPSVPSVPVVRQSARVLRDSGVMKRASVSMLFVGLMVRV